MEKNIKEKNVIAFVQARLSSMRYPKKVLQKVGDHTIIELVLRRLSKSNLIDQIVLVTSDDKSDDNLVKEIESYGFECFRGALDNVLDRFYQAARIFSPDVIVRITGDCPIIDPQIVDTTIKKFFQESLEYCNNTTPPTFPDGLDVEVFSSDAFEKVFQKSTSSFEQEHVTPFFYTSGVFRTGVLESPGDFSAHRWVVDEPSDLKKIQIIFKHFSPNIYFSWEDVVELHKTDPRLLNSTSGPKRNEGSFMNSGQKLWKRAQKSILGGTMLYSKRPDLFLPQQWPTYYSKAKGCKVFDLDNREYTDVALMGVGTNLLGYANIEIDDAVIKALQKSNMSSLNCPEEVYLAERLCEIHPWSSICKFARSGGEANTIAIRIARAATGKEKIAFCGYHGWHDWYLSAEKDKKGNLNEHLMTGLKTDGVPDSLVGSSIPFMYNDIEGLEKIIAENDIAAVKMEVMRFAEPKDDFLQRVRRLTAQHGIVLIFDECTSGFRETFGGLHLKFDVNPDIAVFGKALGNGYAITAVVGSEAVMKEAQNSFISSTFWTERIGSVAALKTLEVMERKKSWKVVTEQGLKVWKIWTDLSEEFNVGIKIIGTPPLANFVFEEFHLKKKTYLTQEMLKRNYLASTGFFLSTEHSDKVLSEYKADLSAIFYEIGELDEEKKIDEKLEVDPCGAGFRRLN